MFSRCDSQNSKWPEFLYVRINASVRLSPNHPKKIPYLWALHFTKDAPNLKKKVLDFFKKVLDFFKKRGLKELDLFKKVLDVSQKVLDFFIKSARFFEKKSARFGGYGGTPQSSTKKKPYEKFHLWVSAQYRFL